MMTTDHMPTMTLSMAKKRAKMLAKIRLFFADRDVLEVQTPIMSNAGNTDVFIESVTTQTHYQNKAITGYLQTSPEFAMKRLLASWQAPIYQICPVFRNNEMGKLHNIEFTMLEWYRPDFTLTQLADELADLLTALYGFEQSLQYDRYADVFVKYVGVHPLQASCSELAQLAHNHGIYLDMGEDYQGWLDVLFSHLVEPNLGQKTPTLIFDYPVATASLAKITTDENGDQYAKRFELYIKGIEIANAYDELADGQALLQRFEEDNKERQQRGLATVPIDHHLLTACDNMPESSGIAVGIDRLLMVLTDADSINEVIGFPTDRA